MRLRIYSDIHLEFGPFSPSKLPADVIILAGDIANGTRGIDWIQDHFPDTPVVLILGNHDFYYASYSHLLRTLRDRCVGTRIHLLENESVTLGGYRFLGCTLWTDFEINGTMDASRDLAAAWMADYRCIDFGSENAPARLSPEETQRFHRESRHWIERELLVGDRNRTVVVTHHAPSAISLPIDPSRLALKPAFASNLDALVASSGIPLWIHGHTHLNVDYQLGATRVFTNQRGYPDEQVHGFQPEGLFILP